MARDDAQPVRQWATNYAYKAQRRSRLTTAAKSAAKLVCLSTEREIFESLRLQDLVRKKSHISNDKPPPSSLFILGSPRTGSTFVYQLIARAFKFPYLSNETEKNHAHKAIEGIVKLIPHLDMLEIPLQSTRGKTDGQRQPSEASAVMASWFGGSHPSEIKSSEVIASRANHFQNTITASQKIFAKPILIKNAWNCYRIASIASTIPNARFLWITRDPIDAALSDLKARRTAYGTGIKWSSATPANINELIKLPDYAQVLESQFAFNRSVRIGLDALPKIQSHRLDYADLLEDADQALAKISGWLSHPIREKVNHAVSTNNPPKKRSKNEILDIENLNRYFDSHRSRFTPYL